MTKKIDKTAALAAASASASFNPELPIDQIDESPTNPRKTFVAVEELAADIALRGVLEPVLVRPRDGGRYELVFGARRFRASKLANKTTIMALIREMSDPEVIEVQIVENAQRADLHPLEEADAYRVLHEQHGYSVEDLAAKISKSEAYIYARLKLCGLVPEAREAFLAERLSAATALLVARIPVDLQAKATEEIAYGGEYLHEAMQTNIGGEYEDDDEEDKDHPDSPFAEEINEEAEAMAEEEVRRSRQAPMSVAQARSHVMRKYMLRLASAPFDRDDVELVAEAGSCTACPKRTGKQRELFGDIASPDVCTDPGCFGAKKDAAWRERATEAEAKGQEVLPENEAKKIFAYGHVAYNAPFVDLDAKAPGDKGTWREALGDAAPAPVLARNETTGEAVELVDKKALAKAAKSVGLSTHGLESNATRHVASPKEKAAGEKRAKERDLIAQIAPMLLGSLVGAVEKKAPTDALWRLLVRIQIEASVLVLDEVCGRRGLLDKKAIEADRGGGSVSKVMRAVLAHLETLKGTAIVALLAELLVSEPVHDGYDDKSGTEALLAYLKIDAKKIKALVLAEAAEKSTMKASPVKAKKAAAKKGKAKK